MNTFHTMRLFQRVRTEVTEQPTAETLSALCRNDVFRFALSRTGNQTTAEDVAVETFADALRALARFDGRVAVKIWLFGIARRKTAD
ncbi:MAG TPA: sigma factor [Chthonomonadaceae bacterium]|nr:sigma factor [Chthonomonadaceae bacterium]